MKKLIGAAFAAIMAAGPAGATVFEFAYSNTFNTRVENVTSNAPALRGSYRDPDADRGLYNGSSSLLITGRYDDSAIRFTSSDQSAAVEITSIAFDALEVVFARRNQEAFFPAVINLTQTGGFTFSFDLANVGMTDVWETTSVTSQLNARGPAGPVFSLSRAGEYGTDNSKLSNLYGRNNAEYDPVPVSDSPYYFVRYGALAANSFTTGGNRPVLEGGTFTLIAAVPEPASWATMIVGCGVVGGLARRRRAGCRRLAAS